MTNDDRPPTRDDLELEVGELRETSDRLLEMLPRIRAMEERKRAMHIGTDEFVEMAGEVEALARHLSAWAVLEQDIAREAAVARERGALGDVAIDQAESRPLQRVLADWREATIRHDQAEPGSAEQARAAADMTGYRDEYHQLAARILARDG